MTTTRERPNCHPSYLPLWDSVPERGPRSPHAYVESPVYRTVRFSIELMRNIVTEHTHMLLLGDGTDNAIAQRNGNVEDFAE